MSRPILECVPNVSEGRDRGIVERFAGAVGSVEGVRLMDIHMDPDHHRSVLSFLGPPAQVEEAALALADAVFPTIDMRSHRGVHPRIYRRTSIPRVFDLIRSEAARRGVGVKRSELVGLAPRDAFEERPPDSVGLFDFTPSRRLDTYLE